MNSVSKSMFATALFVAIAAAGSLRAFAQDEEDVIKKKDNTSQTGKVKSEDLKGCTVTISKADVTMGWNQIKSVRYSGSPELNKARALVDANNTRDAIPLLEQARAKTDLRALLKPHVLNLLGSCYQREGDLAKAIELYTELFKVAPKTQFLLQGAGENLINANLALDNTKGANDALQLLLEGAKLAGADTTPLNLLRGRVQEASKDFASASSTYKSVLDAATSDADTKAAAELGIGRCLWGLGKGGEAEAKYRGMVSKELPSLVLAGAWNGLGDVMLQGGRDQRSGDLITDALYAYLRGCVLYVPQSGEPTAEYERAVRGAADCFRALSEIEKDEARKKSYAQRAQERLTHLQTKFPGSRYIPGTK